MALTYDDAMTALRNADAAGDTEAAQRLAGIASKLRTQAAPAPMPRGRAEIPTAPPGGAALAGPPAAQPVAPPPAPGQEPGAREYGIGALETAGSLATGATTGMAGGILGLINNAVKRAGYALTGVSADQLPSTEQAFQGGMEAGTYQPRTPTGQQMAAPVGQFLAEQGPSVLGLGPELAAVGRAMTPTARAMVRPAVATAAEKVVPTITPERAKNVQAGMEQGITPAPHQLAENKFVKLAGEAAETTPGAFGGMRRTERQSAFNRALIKQVNPEEATAQRLTPDVLDKAMSRSGGKIGDLTAGAEIPGEDVAPGFRSLRRRLERATDDDRRVVGGYIDDFERMAAENDGKIPGTAFKDLNSELGEDIRANAGNKTARLLSDVQDTVMDAFRDRLAPEDRAAYDTARREYAKAKTILPLVAKALEGDISPGALMGAVNATKAGKNAMARGHAGELGELARAGRYLVDQKSSNTSERGLIYKFILDPLKETAKAATIYPAAAAYNLAGPAITRAMVRKGLRRAGEGTIAEGAEVPPAGGAGPAGEPPAGGAGPAGGPSPAPTDPRLAEIAKMRENAPEAVQTALDEHEKTVRKTIAAEQATRKRAADVKALEAAAQATQDVELRKTLQAKADKLRDEKIPVGEAKELATTPTLPVEKTGKIPVGKVTEGQPALPATKAEKIPVGQATEITPEVVAPEEAIPVGEAAPLPSNVPAAEVVSNVPAAEPISNVPTVERTAAPVSNIPKSEPGAQTPDYTHGALFKAAELAGIETRGRRPSEVRAAFEASWAKEHGLSPFEAERAKTVARALDIDEKAVETAATQHEKSPRAFDRAIDKIIAQGEEIKPWVPPTDEELATLQRPASREASMAAKKAYLGRALTPEEQAALDAAKKDPNAFETKQAANSGEGPTPNPPAGGGGKGAPGAGGAGGAAKTGGKQPGANSPGATRAEREGNQPGGSASEAIPVGEVIEGAPETPRANNASGESEASSEAINRAAREKAAGQERVLIDRDGTIRPLIGPSAVDQVARAGQVIAQRGVGAKEWTVLSSGPEMSKGAIARATAKLPANEPRGFEKGARERKTGT